ncbi:MAG: hypothetical protein Fur0041_17300 [Bacteroidia bacterium]
MKDYQHFNVQFRSSPNVALFLLFFFTITLSTPSCSSKPEDPQAALKTAAIQYNDRIVGIHEELNQYSGELAASLEKDQADESRKKAQLLADEAEKLIDSLRKTGAFQNDSSLMTAAIDLMQAYKTAALQMLKAWPIVYAVDTTDTAAVTDSIPEIDTSDVNAGLIPQYERISGKSETGIISAYRNFRLVQEAFASRYGFDLVRNLKGDTLKTKD